MRMKETSGSMMQHLMTIHFRCWGCNYSCLQIIIYLYNALYVPTQMQVHALATTQSITMLFTPEQLHSFGYEMILVPFTLSGVNEAAETLNS